MGPMYFDLCRLYPFSPQPPQQCWASTCHLSTFYFTLYRGCGFAYLYDRSKAVGREDKTTRRVRVRVLALLENPRRVRVRVLALLENPRRDPAHLKNPRRETSTQSLVQGSRLVSGHPRPRSIDRVWNEDEDVH
jgi:hypothetical protein